MKGHQINFFLTPEDLAELEKRIRGAGPFILFECRSDDMSPRFLNDTAVAEMGKTPLKICLARPEDILAVKFQAVKAQSNQTVDTLVSPIIELQRCFFDGKHLKRGRLYFISNFYNENGALISKDAAFVLWAKSVLQAAKKDLKRDINHQSYIGKHAEHVRAQDKCTFKI